MSSVGQLVPPVTRAPPNDTIQFHGPHIEGTKCSKVEYGTDPLLAVIYAMYIVFGVVYTLFGYRCFKASMFLTGFTFASGIVYLICLQEHLMPPYGNVCVSLTAGILFGLITMLIQFVGLFVTGLHTGVLLAIAGLAIYDHFIETRPNEYWICLTTLFVSGIFFAVINLQWKRVVTIFGTSIYGGAIITISIDYYIEKLIMIKWLWGRAWLNGGMMCARSLLVLAAWPCAAAAGVAAQAAITARHIRHEQGIGTNKRRPRLSAAESRQSKYRYLYQVRTAHGDVISQSYVQALQRRARPAASPRSDCTALTALPN